MNVQQGPLGLLTLSCSFLSFLPFVVHAFSSSSSFFSLEDLHVVFAFPKVSKSSLQWPERKEGEKKTDAHSIQLIAVKIAFLKIHDNLFLFYILKPELIKVQVTCQPCSLTSCNWAYNANNLIE